MKYNGLIFDFDYTLGDSTEGIFASVNYALERLGHPQADREAVRKTIGLHLEETYRVLVLKADQPETEEATREAEPGEFIKTQGNTMKPPQAENADNMEVQAEKFAGYFREKADQVMVANTSFFPGALEVLQKWKGQGIRLAIVTTKYHYRIDAILEKYHAAGLFDVIVGGEDVTLPKPNPEGILKVQDFWQMEKEQILYVGDSLVDARTAHAAGMDFAGVTTGTTPKEALERYPNVGVFDSLAEISEEMERNL